MKVIDLGRGLLGIELEPHKFWVESIFSVNRRLLERQGTSEDAIKTCLEYIDYVKRTCGQDPDEMDCDPDDMDDEMTGD